MGFSPTVSDAQKAERKQQSTLGRIGTWFQDVGGQVYEAFAGEYRPGDVNPNMRAWSARTGLHYDQEGVAVPNIREFKFKKRCFAICLTVLLVHLMLSYMVDDRSSFPGWYYFPVLLSFFYSCYYTYFIFAPEIMIVANKFR